MGQTEFAPDQFVRHVGIGAARIEQSHPIGEHGLLGLELAKHHAALLKLTLIAVSYTPLDVYKRQGPTGSKIVPPAAGAIMFVELFYEYEPMITTAFFGRPRINYSASFIVRDKRDLTKIYPTTGVTARTC